MNSLSSRIMVGRAMNGGTNAFEILIDVDKIAQSEMIEPDKSIETFNKLTENVFINDLFK
jgi:hypothetical protein